METQIKSLQEMLEETTRQTKELLQQFTEEELNKIPFEESWTAAQVADHITKSNLSIHRAILLEGSIIDRDPAARVDELADVFLNFDRKFKSPDFIIPRQDHYESGPLIERFVHSAEDLIVLSRSEDLSRMISSQIFGDITKYEILHFVVFHTRRHLRQLKNIRQNLDQKKQR